MTIHNIWNTLPALGPVGLELGINLAGSAILNFGLYYRRYHDKELTTAAALFNVFIFAVLASLSSVDFGIAAGFGLFAILAMFTLRSEPLTKTEMTYFFGSVAIAVICSIQGVALLYSACTVAVVLTAVYIIDHPRILASVSGTKVSLDRIDLELLSQPPAMRAALSERLGVTVLNYQVTMIDYINDMVKLNVFFRKR